MGKHLCEATKEKEDRQLGKFHCDSQSPVLLEIWLEESNFFPMICEIILWLKISKNVKISCRITPYNTYTHIHNAGIIKTMILLILRC